MGADGQYRVYCHLPISSEEGSSDYFSQPVDLDGYLQTLTFGHVKRAFVQECKSQGKLGADVRDGDLQFRTPLGVPIPDVSNVATWTLRNNVVEDLPDAGKTTAAVEIDPNCCDIFLSNDVDRHLAKGGELSYYYAHAEKPLARAPEAWKPKQIVEAQSTAVGTDDVKHNKRQSPFGTDIEKYETITKYSFEDHDQTTVKVFVPLPDVGKLDPAKVESRFAERQFELLVHDYNGKSFRLACAKTHEKIDADRCKHVVRANRINLVLQKAKAGDIWFDLFKKKAIGDDDPP